MVALSLATVYVVWSTTYLAVRYAVGSRSAAGLPPMSVGGLRYLSAGLVLAAFARLRGAPLPSRAQWMRTLPLSVLFFVMGNGFVALAERDLDSGVAALVCGTMPLWGAVLGLAFGDAVRVREWVGLAVGFAGMVALGSGADLRASPVSWALLGVAPIAWAMGSVLARRLALPAGLMAPAAQMIVGGALMLALGAATGERWPAHAPASAWWAVGYLALMGSLAAFSAYVYLLRNARAPVAMSYAYVNPAAAVLLAAAMGDAQLRFRTLAATVLVVVGVVVMVTRKPTPAKSTA
jgi:hypothetical protein